MSEPPSDSGSVGWALVATQFVLLGALGAEVVHARRPLGVPGLLGIAAGAIGSAVIALASNALGRRLRTHPAPASDAVLPTEGVYGVVRHPIYLGLLLLGVACTLIARTPRTAVSLGALAALFAAKSRLEERLLGERFPGYADYARRVPRFVPRFPDAGGN